MALLFLCHRDNRTDGIRVVFVEHIRSRQWSRPIISLYGNFSFAPRPILIHYGRGIFRLV